MGLSATHVPPSSPRATPLGTDDGSPASPAAITSAVFMPTIETRSDCVQRVSASPLGGGNGGWGAWTPATQR